MSHCQREGVSRRSYKPRSGGIAKKGSVKARDKAVKKLDKAVKRAVRKGVPEEVFERTVDVAMEKAASKASPVKRRTARTPNRLVRNAPKAAKVLEEDLD